MLLLLLSAFTMTVLMVHYLRRNWRIARNNEFASVAKQRGDMTMIVVKVL